MYEQLPSTQQKTVKSKLGFQFIDGIILRRVISSGIRAFNEINDDQPGGP